MLDGRFRFENFVVGSANRLAVAAAHAVAEAPGSTYNPLVVYGGSGLGKTHLVAAIAYHARQVQPTLRIEYATVDELVEQYHAAIAAGRTDALTARYQRLDMLLLDDVQFLTGRRELQSELLRLFNRLQGHGHQLVMTSDRPPAEIADVDERLVSRLAGGLLVDVGAPDYETRVAILRTVCAERQLHFDPTVIEEVARIKVVNVRELQGALNRLTAYQSLDGAAIVASEVSRILGESSEAARAPLVMAAAGAPASGGEYESFLSDVVEAVEEQVETWRVLIGEASAYWRGEGYQVAVLDRAMRLPEPPDVTGLLATFAAAVEHLRTLEVRAATVDPALRGAGVFRDVERVSEATELVERTIARIVPLPGPSAEFLRREYDEGESNQLALRAADAVVSDPGKRYNPLFIHGPSGVGKTHLVNAIGNELLARGTAETVACVSAPAFVDELIAALQEGAVERWRARYRAADVLILDDVHFIAGKERTQEELFHVFNALYSRSRPIILTSDRPPKELVELEERLRSRFEGGLVVSIAAPDRALREKLYARYLSLIVASNGEAAGVATLAGYLAERQAESVREIGGIVTRLTAIAQLRGVPLSLELARTELEGANAPQPAPVPRTNAVDTFFLDDEKVIWQWPDLGARLIEELR
jgi:chromosomal replication initiation ATPase DnaA